MYAIIEAGAKQYKVSPGDIIDIELVEAKDSITFDKVLFVSDNDQVEIGMPYVKGASVRAKIIGNGKDDKVTIFKYKRKVNYHRTIGHRQPYTRVKIEEVNHGS
jgi:large subunit ribosomal protein L21